MRKRYYRTGGYIGGVCEGFGIYLDIDPFIIRLLFIALFPLWGGIAIIYLLIMLFSDEYEL
jgi:phage shock protein PspC (stress-responsive transcriptional regulator)